MDNLKIRNFNTEQLILYFKKNNLDDFEQVLREKDIDGEQFLGLSEYQIALWRLPPIKRKKLWSFLTKLKENPYGFISMISNPKKPNASKILEKNVGIVHELENLNFNQQPNEMTLTRNRLIAKKPIPTPPSPSISPQKEKKAMIPEPEEETPEYLAPNEIDDDQDADNFYESPPPARKVSGIEKPSIVLSPPDTGMISNNGENSRIQQEYQEEEEQIYHLPEDEEPSPPIKPRTPQNDFVRPITPASPFSTVSVMEDDMEGTGKWPQRFKNYFTSKKNSNNGENVRKNESPSPVGAFNRPNKLELQRMSLSDKGSSAESLNNIFSRPLPTVPPLPSENINSTIAENLRTALEIRRLSHSPDEQSEHSFYANTNDNISDMSDFSEHDSEGNSDTNIYGNIAEAEEISNTTKKSEPYYGNTLDLTPIKNKDSPPKLPERNYLPPKKPEKPIVESHNRMESKEAPQESNILFQPKARSMIGNNSSRIDVISTQPYFKNITRKEAMALLENLTDGAFILRPGKMFFASITIKYAKYFFNLGLLKTQKGRVILKAENSQDSDEFDNVDDLIEYYIQTPLTVKHSTSVIEVTLKKVSKYNILK